MATAQDVNTISTFVVFTYVKKGDFAEMVRLASFDTYEAAQAHVRHLLSMVSTDSTGVKRLYVKIDGQGTILHLYKGVLSISGATTFIF